MDNLQEELIQLKKALSESEAQLETEQQRHLEAQKRASKLEEANVSLQNHLIGMEGRFMFSEKQVKIFKKQVYEASERLSMERRSGAQRRTEREKKMMAENQQLQTDKIRLLRQLQEEKGEGILLCDEIKGAKISSFVTTEPLDEIASVMSKWLYEIPLETSTDSRMKAIKSLKGQLHHYQTTVEQLRITVKDTEMEKEKIRTYLQNKLDNLVEENNLLLNNLDSLTEEVAMLKEERQEMQQCLDGLPLLQRADSFQNSMVCQENVRKASLKELEILQGKITRLSRANNLLKREINQLNSQLKNKQNAERIEDRTKEFSILLGSKDKEMVEVKKKLEDLHLSLIQQQETHSAEQLHVTEQWRCWTADQMAAFKKEVKERDETVQQLETEKAQLKTQLEEAIQFGNSLKKEISSLEEQLTRTRGDYFAQKAACESQSEQNVQTQNTLMMLLSERERRLEEIRKLGEGLAEVNDTCSDLLRKLDLSSGSRRQLEQNVGQPQPPEEWLRHIKASLRQMEDSVESVRTEYGLMLSSLCSEGNTADRLKEDVYQCQEGLRKKNDKFQEMQLKLDFKCRELNLAMKNIQELNEEKRCLLEDSRGVKVDLEEKEERWKTELSDLDITYKSKELQMTSLRAETEMELEIARKQVDENVKEISQKKAELSDLRKTLQDFETKDREIMELKIEVEKLESMVAESGCLLKNYRDEVHSLQNTNIKQKETIHQLEKVNDSLQKKMKQDEERFSTQEQELKRQIGFLRHIYEFDKCELNKKLGQAETESTTMEEKLKTLVEREQQQKMEIERMESTIEGIQIRLATEMETNQNFTEQLKLLTKEANDYRIQLVATKETLTAAQAKLQQVSSMTNKQRSQLETQRKARKELEATLLAYKKIINDKCKNIRFFQSEVRRYQQENRDQQTVIQGYEEKLESLDAEKDGLAQRLYSLTTDTELLSAQILEKKNENFQLKEEMSSLEFKVHESNAKLDLTESKLQLKEKLWNDINVRLKIKEKELMQFKTDEKNISLSRNALTSQKCPPNCQSDQKGDLLLEEKYKQQILELQSEINKERSLLQIVRTSLDSAESERKRLRRHVRHVHGIILGDAG